MAAKEVIGGVLRGEYVSCVHGVEQGKVCHVCLRFAASYLPRSEYLLFRGGHVAGSSSTLGGSAARGGITSGSNSGTSK